MKKFPAALILTMISSLPLAQADMDLTVVKNYDRAGNASTWVKPKNDQVPKALLEVVEEKDPENSYSRLFPGHFLQQEKFVVCYINCSVSDQFKLNNESVKSFSPSGKMNSWDIVEQNNIYYWLTKYTSYLSENFDFNSQENLQVFTNHIVRDENDGKTLKNNAFYNPANNTLSFLPATDNWLFRMMGGRLNRSGFDPSVILHETSHFLFEHLFANPVNEEIKGLNEGFSDYMANTFLNNPKIGLVMLQGKALRDSSSLNDSTGKFKGYEPRLEAHDMGERVAVALWKSREMVSDKMAFDKMVIESVSELSQNAFATIHDFKKIMMRKIGQELPAMEAVNAIPFWDMVFPGNPTVVSSLEFMDKPRKNQSALGFKIRQIISEDLARQMGMKEREIKSNFIMVDQQTVADNQEAFLVASENADDSITTPFWVVVDEKKNNIVAAYGLDKQLITAKSEVKKVSTIASQVIRANVFIKDFIAKTKVFSQLASNEGEFAKGYKVKSVTGLQEEMILNGESTEVLKTEIKLKAKFLSNILSFGALPEIDSIVLYSTATGPKNLANYNGQKVVGYRLLLKSGSGQEVILNKF